MAEFQGFVFDCLDSGTYSATKWSEKCNMGTINKEVCSQVNLVPRVSENKRLVYGGHLAKGRFVVEPRTAVTMSTCSNFEVE